MRVLTSRLVNDEPRSLDRCASLSGSPFAATAPPTTSDALLYATRENGQILRSNDGGDSWQTQWPTKNHRLNRLIALSPSPDGQAVHAVAVGQKGLVLTSVDGESWSEAGGSGTEDIHDVIQDVRGEGDRLYAVNEAGKLLISADWGLSWHAKETGVAEPLRSLCLTAAGDLIAVGNYGAALVISSKGNSATTD